ncbi:subtilase family protein [Nostoc commune NIES-4072]|uniref:Subtilase family protein n=1 Tax=Nostoc commune NIES-4072 TaxID=2005467 RepID=A0A2R5G091_NOSCO|nr:subtilase family protein [Nostoc commune HK-02]GBG23709.1 subtilase family protein [Nostoc commune NIES-4072]
MTNSTNRPTAEFSRREGAPIERELIVIARREAGLRATREGVASVEGADVTPLADLLTSESVTLRPLFGISEEQIKARTASLAAETGTDVPNLSVYYRVEAPDERLEELAARLREQEVVEAAYVKPPAELPVVLNETSKRLNDMVPLTAEAPSVTPDFTARQAYLDAAPGGIDARYAWTQPGGGGAGVRIVDIEGAWRFTHEDLTQNQGGVVGGTQSTDLGWRNHGTAVVGVFGSDRTTFGCTGICPDANVRAISIFGGLGSAGAICQAADMLNSGDIILIELHRSGPRSTGNWQQGFIAIEWWPDDFDAIRYATSRGVIVVEAAGNGAENLDDPTYNTPAPGFPSDWTNPFNRANRDSGAIVVGAGAPPPGTHGRNIYGPDRSRLDFSNYGALIDAQGWGYEVTTCGYGDLQGGSNEDFWYTDEFSGTSSASPIVVGALACVQGVLRTRGVSPLSPPAARNLLRTTGSPQQNAPGRPSSQRIGNRPNLREMLVFQLGLIVYGWDGTQMTTKWSTGDIGQGTGALNWLVADVDGDGKAELLQPWNSP